MLVYENTTLITDGTGLPGKSFRVVIWDGAGMAAANNDVAQAIWDSKPSGILSFGTTASGVAIDSTGQSRTLLFDRAVQVPIYIICTTTPATLTTAGTAAVKAAMAAYATANYNLGISVIDLPLRASGIIPGVTIDVPTSSSAPRRRPEKTHREYADLDVANCHARHDEHPRQRGLNRDSGNRQFPRRRGGRLPQRPGTRGSPSSPASWRRVGQSCRSSRRRIGRSSTRRCSRTTRWRGVRGASSTSFGYLVGVLRNGLDDADFLALIKLQAKVNRSRGTPEDILTLGVLMSGVQPPFYLEEPTAGFYLGCWNIGLNYVQFVPLLRQARAAGVYGVLLYTTWPDGGDVQFSSVWDFTVGQAGLGSVYDATQGGLLVASVGL